MKVAVVGLGYIGLPTSLMMASHGIATIGIDYNVDLINDLLNGKITFDENGLDGLFQEACNGGIEFGSEYKKADIYIVAVPTPYDKNSKKIDPVFVINAVNSILDVCEKGTIIVIESTIAPGTIDKFIRPAIIKKDFKIGKDVHLVHAPERIIPGKMIYELKNNSRTIGADDSKIGEKVKSIYKSFCSGDIIITDIRTAEMTKVVENTYRDINIAFANELAKICRYDNMDVYEIIRIANMHPRVNILSPGPGVGGHCISVDPWFLVGDYPGLTSLIRHARHINDSMPEFVLGRIAEIMSEHKIEDISRVGLYGLTYKEDVDDTRESPTLQLLESMQAHLAKGIKIYDPMVKNKFIAANQCTDFEDFLKNIDLIVIMVAHKHIKDNMDMLNDKVILDTRNICNLINTYKL